MRPQEIPLYVAEGLFDLGIGGYDWVLERGCENDVEIIMNLNYSKQSHRPVRLVVAVSENSDIQKPTDIKPGSKVTTEYVSIAAKYFEKLGIPVKIDFSFGTTEAKVPEIADVAVELTESGSSLRANNLKIIDTVMESSTVLMANKKSWQDPEKRGHINDIVTLLRGCAGGERQGLDENERFTRGARCGVGHLAVNETAHNIPAFRRQRQSALLRSGIGGRKDGINTLIPNLKAAGAEDIIEIPISKVIR